MRNIDKIKVKIINVTTGQLIDTLRLQALPSQGDIMPLTSGDYMVHAKVHGADMILIQCEPMEQFMKRQRELTKGGPLIKTPGGR